MIIDAWGGVCSWCLIRALVHTDGLGTAGARSFPRYNTYIPIICTGIELSRVEYL